MKYIPALLILSVMAHVASHAGEIPDEFKIKREAIFEFAQKPVATRNGNNVTIESKAFCDATVATENSDE